MNGNFKLGVYVDQTEQMHHRLISLYAKYEKNELIEALDNTYKSLNADEKIRLAFVGQYSAGKSTIIKALTGNKNIVIDSDIATSQVTNYNWGSVILTDTPGLNTNENLEHDTMAIEAIRISDLLVYCITSDLFREVTRKDFKNLANEYRSKLFLVINKMNKETGDYDQLSENYSNTINKTLAPEYSIADFHHFFFDAADYLDGKEDDDIDLIEDSHFEQFIDALNVFIELKGLSGKLLTPVILMKDSVDDALINIEDDEHERERKILVQRICKVVEEKKKNFVKACNGSIQDMSRKFILKGDEVATHMGEKGFKFTDEDFQVFVDPLQTKISDSISEFFQKYANEVDEDVKRVLSSELATHFFKEANLRLDKTVEGKNRNTETLADLSKGMGTLGAKAASATTTFLDKMCKATAGQKISIWTVNGSELHKVVKNVGHMFGHKFKPFEALKISKNIANISKWLGPVLTGVGTVVEVFGMIADKYADKKLSKAKDETKQIFKIMAEETVGYYNAQVAEASKEFDKITASLQQEIHRIEDESENNKELKKELFDIKKDLNNLQRSIEYGSSTKDS